MKDTPSTYLAIFSTVVNLVAGTLLDLRARFHTSGTVSFLDQIVVAGALLLPFTKGINVRRLEPRVWLLH